MPRRRLGVALLLPPVVTAEIQGLRRGVGDRALARIPAHVTLVSPVNVRSDDLYRALGLLRRAAAAVPGPLRLTLGPPASFVPANQVLYLEVGGELDRLRAVHGALQHPPLTRPAAWPWVPHVTLAEGIADDRNAAAVQALERYALSVDVDAVTLLEEVHATGGRRWLPLADAALGAPIVVGAGGLPLTLQRSQLVDPEGSALLGALGRGGHRVGRAPAESVRDPDRTGRPEDGDPGPAAVGADDGTGTRPAVVLTARREGAAVGVAVAWRADDGGHVAVGVAEEARRQGIGSQLLAHLEDAVRDAGWACPSLRAHGPPAFYRARTRWCVPGPVPAGGIEGHRPEAE